MSLPLQRLGVVCAWVLVTSCASVPTEQLDLVFASTAASATQASLGCGRSAFPVSVSTRGLDPEAITLVTWNIHKTGDPGWEGDLKRFAASHSLVLLQEAVLHGELRGVIEGSGHYWNLASAFALDGLPTGVMTAATVPPIAVCSLRQDEPLLRLPKAASVTRYRLAGRTETLLVANIHSVNFTLALDAYVGQLEALVTELAEHRDERFSPCPIRTGGQPDHHALPGGQNIAAVGKTRLGQVEHDLEHVA